MEDIAQTMVVLGAFAAVILLPIYWRAQNRRRVLDTLKDMANSGNPLSSDLVLTLLGPAQRVQPVRPSRDMDLRRGYLLVALAIAIAIIGGAISGSAYAAGESDAQFVGIGIASIGAIPGAIGVAFILLGLGQKREG